MIQRFIFSVTSILFLVLNISAQEFDGYALYSARNTNTTYLIDKNGDIAHTWSLDRPTNYAVQLLPTGNIIRGVEKQGNIINGAAVGGRVEEVDPQGNLIWSFDYSSASYVSHHDITLMPDGNVMLIAWEVKTNAELQELGYLGTANKYPTHFIEVSQIDDTDQGEIVWEWHLIDHMIQDVDANKPNFGVVADHPELMDINVASGGGGGGPGGGGGGDWFHVNGIDYNSELDLITFSSRFLSEIFIIDHSCTVEEAAGHTGGNFGKGGDILYRWGNPSNYGLSTQATIDGPVHDSRWVPDDGRPRAGFIQFFNNEYGQGESAVEAIDLPWNSDKTGFERIDGQPFGPSQANFRHITILNANGQSSSYSLPNGNIYANLSGKYMYEVDSDSNVVWQYNDGPVKGFRYICAHPGIQQLVADGVIEDLCMISSTSDIPTISLNVFPNPSNGVFIVDALSANDQIKRIEVFNSLYQKVITVQSNQVDLSNQSNGIYYFTIHLNNGKSATRKVSLAK